MGRLSIMLRDLFRQIEHRNREPILFEAEETESALDFAKEILQEIVTYECHCHSTFFKSRKLKCPACLATVALKDKKLMEPVYYGPEETD